MKDASYEQLETASKDRFLGFVKFLLTGEWVGKASFSRDIPFLGHVFTQSGHMHRLQNIGRTMTKFIHMNDINDKLVPMLQETCGLSDQMLPIEKKVPHAKVEGLDDLMKTLWSNANEGTAENRVLRAFEAICLMNAVDYACLAPELNEPPPIVCRNAFQKHLPKV